MKAPTLLLLSALFSLQPLFNLKAVTSGILNEEWISPDLTHGSIALDNPYFRVIRDSAACTLAYTENFGTRLIVALDKIKIIGSQNSQKLKRGQIAVFREASSFELPVCLLYTSPSPRDRQKSRMPSSA